MSTGRMLEERIDECDRLREELNTALQQWATMALILVALALIALAVGTLDLQEVCR